MRPEERWWLYSKTAAEAGGANQTQRGWRKALYYALSDSVSVLAEIKTRTKTRKSPEDGFNVTLSLNFAEKGDI